ncbi:MAG: hypothetical protein NC041_07930 [Bacteroides sp.]|nr:hypothetical protein [Prevotella sp.]MCM1408388.1 hypothetical protein [Treponema brennaborense]MCM1470381.1 hypothetical protein [Bacteroides sp.]
MTTCARCIAEYFDVSLVVIALGTAAIGQALRKICPSLFSVLNGGRKQKTAVSEADGLATIDFSAYFVRSNILQFFNQ